MAERTVVIKECDRLQCRKRKGVIRLRVTVDYPNGEDIADMAFEGDLCPYHVEQLRDKIDMMFHNEKGE